MFAVPTSLSPSRVERFTSCPMVFRFTSTEGIPEPPSIGATKGSLVHRVLELLFVNPRHERSPAHALSAFEQAVAEYRSNAELVLLGLDDEDEVAFFEDCWSLVEAYLRMEDPSSVHEIGIELRLEAQVGSLSLRGIIDRLELDANGGLVITDYKTGRPPGTHHEQSRLGGVHFYSLLCEQVLGRRPVAVRLMYLRDGETITTRPSEQSVRFVEARTRAVWKAIETACLTDGFQPRPGGLCRSCAFRPWCPAFGGNPTSAVSEAPERLAMVPEPAPA